MRAVVLNSPDTDGENMIVTDMHEPRAGPDDVVVRVAFAGCNFADTMMRTGKYPHPKGYPMTAGIEMAGIVESTGSNVTGFSAGDRVAAFSEDGGAFAELCCVPANQVLRVPDRLGLDVAAGVTVQGLTAWHLLHTVSKTNEGDVILVHAVGGGVGLCLTQLGVHAGARILGTTGTAGKEARALEYGAELVINRNNEDFVEAVDRHMKGGKVGKIVDSTGGSILDRSFETIGTLGHVVSYGEAEARPYTNLWEQLVRKSLTFTRFHVGHVDKASPAWREGADTVFGMVGDGSLKVPIEGVFPLDGVHQMYRQLESRQVAGKLLLAINAE